jgi:hypothetical protein
MPPLLKHLETKPNLPKQKEELNQFLDFENQKLQDNQ